MSLLATPFAFLFLFFGFALAQIVSPNCESTWAWSFTSLNQDPCEVVSFMLGTRTGGPFTIGPLPLGYSYFGPSGPDDSNLCLFSTVGYSLTSACGGCQGRTWVTWSEYSFNCINILPPSQFPNPVPDYLALHDVTEENNWDFNNSFAAGGGNCLPCLFPPLDSSEVAPGSTPGRSSHPSSTSTTLSTPSTTSTIRSTTSTIRSTTSTIRSFTSTIRSTTSTIRSTTSTIRSTTLSIRLNSSSTPSSPSSIRLSPSTSGLKAGLNASGIVGGIAAISLFVVVLFFCRRWRYSLTSSAAPPEPESGGDNPSSFVAFDTLMRSHTPSRASSTRDLYTISPMSASQLHG